MHVARRARRFRCSAPGSLRRQPSVTVGSVFVGPGEVKAAVRAGKLLINSGREAVVFYRGMSEAEYLSLGKNGIRPLTPGKANYITQDMAYIEHLVSDSPLGGSFDYIVKFEVKPGTRSRLLSNGALENRGPAIAREGLLGHPELRYLTTEQKALKINLKSEGPGDSLTFGLRQASAWLFNENIINYNIVKALK